MDDSLLPISKFNLNLCKMLKLDNGKKKLHDIIKIQKEFSDNKDIVRYHAIYLIQQQLDLELGYVKP